MRLIQNVTFQNNKKPCDPSGCKAFFVAKNILKKLNKSVDNMKLKLYNKYIELGTT